MDERDDYAEPGSPPGGDKVDWTVVGLISMWVLILAAILSWLCCLWLPNFAPA
jgi:hypothetical protein